MVWQESETHPLGLNQRLLEVGSAGFIAKVLVDCTFCCSSTSIIAALLTAFFIRVGDSNDESVEAFHFVRYLTYGLFFPMVKFTVIATLGQ